MATINQLAAEFQKGWGLEADWSKSSAFSSERPPPREALCTALAGVSLNTLKGVVLDDSLKKKEGFIAKDSVLMKEELVDVPLNENSQPPPHSIPWDEVAVALGRGARRSFRSLECYPGLAIFWASIVIGALRLNRGAFSCVAATSTCVVWCADPNGVTQKLHSDAQLACSKFEGALGIGRKHLHKTHAPLAMLALCIWFIPKSLEMPATMVYGGGLGAIFGHMVGARNEWASPSLETEN